MTQGDDQPFCWYFAFGSNMNSRVLIEQRNISPHEAHPAKLSGHRLVFDHNGYPLVEPGFASMTEDADSEVWGVLYRLCTHDFKRLHLTESQGYRVKDIQVVTSEGDQVICSTYITHIQVKGLKPSRRYLNLLVEGALEHQLPRRYIDTLAKTPSVYIPLLSEAAGFLIRASLRYSAKGNVLNLGFTKLGVRQDDSENQP